MGGNGYFNAAVDLAGKLDVKFEIRQLTIYGRVNGELS